MEGPRKVESINSGQKEKLEVWQKKREEIDKIEDRCDQFRLLQKGNFYPEDSTSGATSPQDATPSPSPSA